jgi:hypothetical protein
MQTLDIIVELSEYYNKEMTPGTIKLYVDTLNDLPPGLVDMAAKEIIKTGKPFMPRVSEIRTVAAELKRASKFEVVDPLITIPGAAQTEADLDERYGTLETHRAICDVFTSGGELSDSQRLVLGMGAHD